MSDRTCNRCGITKELSRENFYKNKDGRDGFLPRCKVCTTEIATQFHRDHPEVRHKWYAHRLRNPESIAKKNAMTEAWRQRMRAEGKGSHIWQKHHLKSKYGLSLEQYNQMLSSQNNACAICQKPDPEKGKALAVDHNHDTGKNRGLLCGLCNKAVGLLKDDAALMIAAADYILEWEKKIATQVA